MTTTANLFPEGQRRGAKATLRMYEAYKAVFSQRKAQIEDLDLVMADLAEFSGYFAVLPTGTSAVEHAEFNGSRSVFARILSLSKLSDRDLLELRAAALEEAKITQQEGER